MDVAPLAREHLEAVARIEQTDGDVRWSRAQFERELALPMSRFFVLKQEGEILGYAGYWMVGEEAQLTNLAVAARERRQGHGQRLLQHLIDHARTERCRVFTLEVRSRNAPAQALYQKAGFILQGRRRQVYTDPADDAILMEKKLS